MLALIASIVVVLLPLLPFVALFVVVRHGPFPNPFWRGETVPGFTALVAGAAFTAGFFGPLLLTPEANQGPLLGIFITGPLGVIVGVLWGLARAARRRRFPDATRPAAT